MAFNRPLLHCTIRAHLSRQILLWVILSFIAVEAIISIPSIFRREKEFLIHQYELYQVQLETLIETTPDLDKFGQRFVQWGRQPELNIVGGKLLNSEAQSLSAFGQTIPEEDVLELPFFHNSTELDNIIVSWIYRDSEAGQIEYIYQLSHPQEQLIGVVKQSDKALRSKLWQYKLVGLGLIILKIALITFILSFILERSIVPRLTRVRNEVKQLNQAIKSGDFSVINESFLQGDFLVKDELNCLQQRLAVMAKQLEVYYEKNQLLTQKLERRHKRLVKLNYKLSEQVTNRDAEIEKQFLYDSLTNLPNRNFLRQCLQQRLQPYLFTPFSVLYLNCDNFLLINNTFGYELGDKLLCQVSDRIQALQIAESVFARLGADEFCLLINQPPTSENLQTLAAAIHGCLATSFEIKHYTIYLSFSIGIVPVDESYCLGNPEDALRDAETAMKLSKKSRLGSYQIFNPQMHQATRERFTLEMELREALNQDELFTYYQPIVNLRTLTIVGFEALIRWDHPQRGMVQPDLFIPCAEETGLIIPIGIKILRQACEQLQRWTQEGFNNLEMSVNISPAQFAYPQILEQIDTVLADTGLSPHQLKLEITEGVIFDHPQTGIELTRALRQRNIRICIDDFGTGYSSLSYLTQFPANTLKIDRAFITKMKSSHRDEAVVQAIIDLGRALNMDILAEGIETYHQCKRLQKLGCVYGQGYGFSPPLSAEQASYYLLHPPEFSDWFPTEVNLDVFDIY